MEQFWKNPWILEAQSQATILVELGTQRGDTAEGLQDNFQTIYTFEILDEVYKAARDRLAPYKNIHVYHLPALAGLSLVLPQLGDERCLFFIDDHEMILEKEKKHLTYTKHAAYICAEIALIRFWRQEKGDVILVDDVDTVVGDLSLVESELRKLNSDCHLDRVDANRPLSLLRALPRLGK